MKREYIAIGIDPAVRSNLPSVKALVSGPLRILVSIDAGRHHLSVSCEDRLPTWEEFRDVRYDLIPDNVFMVQALPPRKHYMNIHPFTLHAWETKDDLLIKIMSHGL